MGLRYASVLGRRGRRQRGCLRRVSGDVRGSRRPNRRSRSACPAGALAHRPVEEEAAHPTDTRRAGRTGRHLLRLPRRRRILPDPSPPHPHLEPELAAPDVPTPDQALDLRGALAGKVGQRDHATVRRDVGGNPPAAIQERPGQATGLARRIASELRRLLALRAGQRGGRLPRLDQILATQDPGKRRRPSCRTAFSSAATLRAGAGRTGHGPLLRNMGRAPPPTRHPPRRWCEQTETLGVSNPMAACR
jgi:hypothetical protein